MKTAMLHIYGSVQGVLFRHSAKQKAEEHNIQGYARNEPDGSVVIEAQGEEKNLEAFIEWCRKGPASAVVEKVAKQEVEPKKFTGFKVL